MAALARGLKEGVRNAPVHVSDIHVFADNQAALASILAAGCGPAQLLAVAACESVRPWLEASKQHKIHLWWCPGHFDVPGNVAVDKEAGMGTSEPSNAVSFAYARQQITAQAYQAWRKDMTRPQYREHHNMMAEDEFKQCKHTATTWHLKAAGRSCRKMAQLTRFMSGHFPHGEFRERFHLDGQRTCWCGSVGTETRNHIWFDCPLWIRKHGPPAAELERVRRLGRNNPLDFDEPAPEGVDPVQHFLQGWRNTPQGIDNIREFLQLNPMVGTFEWGDLVEEAISDRDEGVHDSWAIWKVTMHTEMRKRAYERWSEAHPAKPLSEFNLRFAEVVVDKAQTRFQMSLEERKALRKEFTHEDEIAQRSKPK